jgi:hypothetical protein
MLTDDEQCQHCGAVDGHRACVEDGVCRTCRTELLFAADDEARDRAEQMRVELELDP